MLAAGFQLKGEQAGKPESGRERGPLQTLLGKYWQPLSLAGLMLVAALLPSQIGQPLFTLATLWGCGPSPARRGH